MPITSSAKKALRQTKTHRKVNIKRQNELKAVIKAFKKLVATDKKEAEKFVSQLYARIDKSAKTGIIKLNKAARLKSRLVKKLVTK